MQEHIESTDTETTTETGHEAEHQETETVEGTEGQVEDTGTDNAEESVETEENQQGEEALDPNESMTIEDAVKALSGYLNDPDLKMGFSRMLQLGPIQIIVTKDKMENTALPTDLDNPDHYTQNPIMSMAFLSDMIMGVDPGAVRNIISLVAGIINVTKDITCSSNMVSPTGHVFLNYPIFKFSEEEAGVMDSVKLLTIAVPVTPLFAQQYNVEMPDMTAGLAPGEEQ